jgi:hypothetical protein
LVIAAPDFGTSTSEVLATVTAPGAFAQCTFSVAATSDDGPLFDSTNIFEDSKADVNSEETEDEVQPLPEVSVPVGPAPDPDVVLRARIGALVREQQALTDDEDDFVQSAPTPVNKRKRDGKGKGNEPAAGACCQEGQEDLKHFLAHVTVLCCVVVGEN